MCFGVAKRPHLGRNLERFILRICHAQKGLKASSSLSRESRANTSDTKTCFTSGPATSGTKTCVDRSRNALASASESERYTTKLETSLRASYIQNPHATFPSYMFTPVDLKKNSKLNMQKLLCKTHYRHLLAVCTGRNQEPVEKHDLTCL